MVATRRARGSRGGECQAARRCDRTIGLHRHHTAPFGETHHTTYAELGNVCDQHHHLIHDRDHTIDDHHDGTWSLRAPPDQAAA